MSRKKRAPKVDPTEAAHKAGEHYVLDQIQSTYFHDWVRDQMFEAEEMRQRDPNSVIPLESPSDFRKVARNMLQQLGWDIRRDLRPQNIPSIDATSSAEVEAFWEGLDDKLHDPVIVDELTSEVMRVHEEVVESQKPAPPPAQQALPGVRAREAGPHQRHRRRGQYADWIADVAEIMERRGQRYENVSVSFWRQQFQAGMTPEQAVAAASEGVTERRRPITAPRRMTPAQHDSHRRTERIKRFERAAPTTPSRPTTRTPPTRPGTPRSPLRRR
jgi:hypothetical protein